MANGGQQPFIRSQPGPWTVGGLPCLLRGLTMIERPSKGPGSLLENARRLPWTAFSSSMYDQIGAFSPWQVRVLTLGGNEKSPTLSPGQYHLRKPAHDALGQ